MVRDMIAAVDPDIILLTRFDFDLDLMALTQFASLLSQAGSSYPFRFSSPPNSGVASGLDLDGDGRLGEPEDAVGYGEFSGQGGMALLSKFPIQTDAARDFSPLLWSDMPDGSGKNFPNQRLSSVAHWKVPIRIPDWGTPLELLAYHAGTPAFDGPTRRNSQRNEAENQFWQYYLDGHLPVQPPKGSFVILGDSNLDPADGLGQRQIMQALLADPRVQDPRPTSQGAVEAAHQQAGANQDHRGDPALDTADFKDVGGPGNLRVDYVLPSADLSILDAGVFWPASEEPEANILDARDLSKSWHGLVWVDIAR